MLTAVAREVGGPAISILIALVILVILGVDLIDGGACVAL
jgi:hypothetical protein